MRRATMVNSEALLNSAETDRYKSQLCPLEVEKHQERKKRGKPDQIQRLKGRQKQNLLSSTLYGQNQYLLVQAMRSHKLEEAS